jgi:hypothetical protein
VWCYGAQSYRAFGTAAEYTVVPLEQVVELPEAAPLEQGACLGIPRAMNQALGAGWQGLDIAEIVPLDQIARAHESVEQVAKAERVIVAI